MTGAVVGLVGILFGAMMTQVGALFTDRRQARNEAIRWNRDQTSTAYDNTVRHLLRVANRRSKITVKGAAIIDEEGVRQLFEDLVEAQFWIHTPATRCEVAQIQRITEAAELIDEFVKRITEGGAIPTVPTHSQFQDYVAGVIVTGPRPRPTRLRVLRRFLRRVADWLS